jgi:hypothetical protein
MNYLRRKPARERVIGIPSFGRRVPLIDFSELKSEVKERIQSDRQLLRAVTEEPLVSTAAKMQSLAFESEIEPVILAAKSPPVRQISEPKTERVSAKRDDGELRIRLIVNPG